MRITVNSTAFEVGASLTHHEVARLVDADYDNRKRVRVRFAGAGDGTQAGVLRAGESIRVVEGMRLEVCAVEMPASK